MVTSARPSGSWSPWRAVVGFGVVSLSADMVYEGARSVTGPLLASLGASAVLVGLVTGVGEAMALVLRLVSGRWADRSGRYWTLTLVGYGIRRSACRRSPSPRSSAARAWPSPAP
ncbi:hypothetical protein [Microlunatus antarcticus]|uniref:MFS family permease n=1 Tax=Microlunatus antarcticus TaxID=53388 RepID=A0A7W5JUF6_9ACTN|nr:hypothetical protein [Microlunatus antarcticus]MBB3326276.1 MFS family permease [Microlunatus antarcticus]